ncbi:toll/interleukin-1 receptor domain-containing protein [Nonlabens ulvanivorans]|uniref:toll/interleukin-1 receptor domain-containing protein n=1 Tax=Nonlabens ulvanivorans TaxID=906888 RepID=UPI0037CC6C0B
MREKPLNIFISYSWDDEAHKEWVKKLADYLIEKGGCDVTLDQYDLVLGGNTMFFMEKAVNNADKVLLILTPNYKLKADKRQGGVGAEYSMISNGLYSMQENNTEFLPILRNGSLQASAPTYVQTTIYHDMTNDLMFEKTAFDLLRVIHDKPEAVKPKRGSIPNFDNANRTKPENSISDGFAESASKILKARRLDKEIKKLYVSSNGVQLVVDSTNRIFKEIEKKANSYSIEMSIPFYTERFNNYNSLRIQVDDYYVILDYSGFQNNNVNQIHIALRSGGDKYFTPGANRHMIVQVAHAFTANNRNRIEPFFDREKKVKWSQEDIVLTETDVVNKVFSLLLDEMGKEGNVVDHG